MEKLNIIISAIAALILFGAFNGVVIKWHNAHGSPVPYADKELERMRQVYIKRWSRLWHRLGFAMRLFIWLIVWFVGRDWLTTSLVIALTAIEYNVSINLINNLKWYYVGTTAKTDTLIRKYLPFINW